MLWLHLSIPSALSPSHSRMKDQRVTFPASLPASAGHMTKFWPVRHKDVLPCSKERSRKNPFHLLCLHSRPNPCTSNVDAQGSVQSLKLQQPPGIMKGQTHWWRATCLGRKRGRMEESGCWMTLQSCWVSRPSPVHLQASFQWILYPGFL